MNGEDGGEDKEKSGNGGEGNIHEIPESSCPNANPQFSSSSSPCSSFPSNPSSFSNGFFRFLAFLHTGSQRSMQIGIINSVPKYFERFGFPSGGESPPDEYQKDEEEKEEEEA